MSVTYQRQHLRGRPGENKSKVRLKQVQITGWCLQLRGRTVNLLWLIGCNGEWQLNWCYLGYFYQGGGGGGECDRAKPTRSYCFQMLCSDWGAGDRLRLRGGNEGFPSAWVMGSNNNTLENMNMELYTISPSPSLPLFLCLSDTNTLKRVCVCVCVCFQPNLICQQSGNIIETIGH